MIRAPRRRSRRGLVIAGAFVVLLLLLSSARFYTDVLWFNEVGFASVLWTTLRMQFLVGVIVGSLVGLFAWSNLFVAARTRPTYRLSDFDRPDPLDRYRLTAEGYLGWIRLGIAVGLGLLAGFGASGGWETFLLWRNRVPFGTEDPQFHKDIAFYVFELPFLDLVTDWAWFAVVASLLLAIGAHYFYGSIRPEARLSGVSRAALAHASVLLGLLALIKAADYWLGKYELNFSPRGQVTGASYTDVHAQLPALNLLVIISVISAALFIANIRFRRLSLPLAAVGIWVLVAFLAGGVWPWWVQRFSVEPQEPQRERPYILRNLSATRSAFGLADVTAVPFPASETLSAEDIEDNEDMLQNVRLWDPAVLEQAYKPLQAIRTYYQFADVDIDRYPIDGQVRQIMLSTRELSLGDLPERSRTWQNLHLQYTHGFGLVASLANASTGAGQPEFVVGDVPGTVEPGAEALAISEQPRIYYGEGFEPDDYSIVNSGQPELDYPVENGVERTQYAGAGGVKVGGMLPRFAFALREGDPNLILSRLITNDSKVLIYRNVRDRVLRTAPFLALDHDPYPAVVDGRLVWIIDAYTSSRHYPYAQRFDASDVVAGDEGTLAGPLSYVRNSVKVVVDAYDGRMQFYIVDEDDPLVAAWRKSFPDLFTDEEPSDSLASHFRYPEDLFEVQSEVYRTYHMEDPLTFYSKEDEWEIPAPPTVEEFSTVESADRLSPTYLLFRLPGATEQEFVLTRPFSPRARNNMLASLVARSDPEHYGELVLLQYPRSRVVPGPQQVDNFINQDVQFSQLRTLLSRAGSTVQFGSLVILPVEDSILYIQPLFVTAEDVGIPELKKVVLVLGEEVAIGDSFDAALSELFGVPDPDVQPQPPRDEDERERVRPADRELAGLIDRAARLYRRAQNALEDGDFETYGRLIERLGRLLQRAEIASD